MKEEVYEYSGYLKTLLYKPDPYIRDSLDHIEFTADDIAEWDTVDDETDKEWVHIPVFVERTDDGVILRGRFEEMRSIEYLDKNDPSFWVPLSSRNTGDERFPVDTSKYPVVEVTYRCKTPKARPAWMWHYPGGLHFDGLQPSPEWRTIARKLYHFGFPEQITDLTFRLYSTTRSREAFEIHSVRFRAMSPGEQEACSKHYAQLREKEVVRQYPLLGDFMPAAVYMKAGTARRQAEAMDMSLDQYMRLALEDIARHHHNCVALEEIETLSRREWEQMLALAGNFGIRFLAMYDWPLDDLDDEGKKLRQLVDENIVPWKDSPDILGWTICDEPPDHTFQAHLDARHLIEEADPNHPLCVMMREPNSLPLFAPFFAASGMTFFKSHLPWQAGEMIQTHYPLSRGQQFWFVSPAFVYGTDTPEWHTCPEMRLMLNSAIANGVRGCFSFTYHNDPIWMNGNCKRSLTGPFLTFSDIWFELGHRFERLQALSPLFLSAKPCEKPGIDIRITWNRHGRSQLSEDIPAIRWHWLEGPDFLLLYIVNNDIGEVSSVYIDTPDVMPGGLAIYDVSDFVRNRSWVEMKRSRHLEMFPGQGQVLLLGEEHVCENWRGRIVEKIMQNDRRQIAVDMEFARLYDLDVSRVAEIMPQIGSGAPLVDLLQIRQARDMLLNCIYESPAITEPRSRLIRANAGICGCDGALCRLLKKGKADAAHELGLKVLPLSRKMTQLRLRLRQGKGAEILEESENLSRRILERLAEIRKLA
jgi:hypothetical protein